MIFGFFNPPGIGKTAVINQVCRIIGIECERINCSANTTLEQLFGSVIPQSVGGKRVFTWKDGKLTKAIKSKKWVLFDEINLAPPEVLDGLVPLLITVGNWINYSQYQALKRQSQLKN